MGTSRLRLLAASSPAVELSDGRESVHGENRPLPYRWWLWPLAAYLLFRIADAVMIVIASHHAGGGINPLTGTPLDHSFGGATAPRGYLTTATNWDGQWYWQVAERGYPHELPRNSSGDVQQNVWAFFPAYPITVRLIMTVTGLSFPLAAVMVSLLAGAAATLLVYRLISPVTDLLGARLAVVVLNTFVCAPAFQIAYTEGMALALLVAALLAFRARRFRLTAVLVLILSLTRAVVLPLAGVFAIYALVGWRRGSSRTEVVKTVGLAVWAGTTTFLWPAIAGLTTGEPKAYLLTQASWNPDIATLPILRFIDRVSPHAAGPWVGVVLVVAATVGVVLALTAGQKLLLLKVWSGTYALYLLAAVDWNSTTIRYFLLAIPGIWAPTDPSTGWPRRHRIWIVAVAGLLGLATQWWWIRYSLTISPEFYQIP